MRFNTPIVKCKAAVSLRAIFLALSLFGTCFAYVPLLSRPFTLAIFTPGFLAVDCGDYGRC